VDADTWLDPDAIGWMVAHLVAREADAVASNVRVGNRHNLWTRWQSLEYVTGLNIDRRAQEVLGVIHTVPGAASAWRRGAVQAAGGFDGRTLAEDTDLTLHLLRAGRRVVFAPQAIAWTEAPEGAGGLFRQRLRWLHGNLQCAWHHSAAWWTPAPWRVRLLALPNLWFAHLGVYLLLPLTLAYAGVARGEEAVEVLGWLFLALFALDVAAALTAYALDRADPVDLAWAPSQRVGYPIFLWAVFAVVASRVARRAPTPWNKLPRRGLPGPTR
jgi:cellulose synthase/poly-beta-1,6-N-acetylglucosamine synthase-like glycosyltransferase